MEALPLDDEELDELEDELVLEDELEELVPEDELEELELELEDELVTVPGDELSPPQAVNPSASSTVPPRRNDCFFKLIIMIGALYGLLRLVQALGIIMKIRSPCAAANCGFYKYSSSHLSTLAPIYKATYAEMHPICVIWIKFSLGR